MNIFSSVKKRLQDSIMSMEQNKADFVKDASRDFSRKRKLSFYDTILLVISMEASSIRSELLKYFSFSLETASSSAFIQQRDKLKPDAFRALFYSFSSKLPSKEYNKYHFYAVDGSDILIPLEGRNEKYCYFRNKNQSDYHQLHLNAIYDLLSEQYAAAYIEPRKGHNERKASHLILDEQSFPKNSIFVFDRGYEGYSLMAHISNQKHYYVMRAKDFSTGGILQGLGIQRLDEFDVLYNKVMVNRLRVEHRQNPERYHRVHYTNTPYFLNSTMREYHLPFRVVRFRLDNGTYECLLTNLPQEEFSINALKRIYNMRWGIETSFRQLKHTIGLLSFHSKKIESIEQEIWARLILYNFCMAVTKNIEIRKTKSQYPCKPNIANAIRVCRRFLKIPLDETPPDMEQLISRELIPVRTERKAPRKQTPQRPRKFGYRM